MDLNLRSITALTEQQITDAKASSPAVAAMNTTQGSVVRAIFRAVSGVGAWFQATALDVLRASRLTSSTGADVDSWMGDFRLTRLPATSASGQLTFSRFGGSTPAAVRVGTLVKTGDGTLSFVVVADTINQRFNPTTNAYEIPADTYSMTVSAQAIAPGTASNVIAGAISLVSSSGGMDQVTNATAFSGGVDAESDDALKARFQAYIASLARATLAAIQAAVAGTRQGLRFTVAANTDPSGMFRPGHMTITVDDGSGAPADSILSAVAASVEVTKALAETYSILPPLTVAANVSLYYEVTAGVDRTLFLLPIEQAISKHIDSLGIGQPLRFSRIFSLAFGVSGSIVNVGGIAINGVPADLNPGPRGLVLAGVISVG